MLPPVLRARAAQQLGPEVAKVYERRVVILIDPTRSMRENRLPEALEIIRDNVLPWLGPGDEVFCFYVGPDFSDSRNRVWRAQLPPVPENAPSVLRARPRNAQESRRRQDLIGELTRLWEDSDTLKQEWTAKLTGVRPPREPHTDYLSALDYVAKLIQGSVVENTVLIIVGDLIQEPPPTPAAVQSSGTPNGFEGVGVRLVYPHDSDRDWDAVLGFWHQYFVDRGAAESVTRTFGEFPSRRPLIARNPLALIRS